MYNDNIASIINWGKFWPDKFNVIILTLIDTQYKENVYATVSEWDVINVTLMYTINEALSK